MTQPTDQSKAIVLDPYRSLAKVKLEQITGPKFGLIEVPKPPKLHVCEPPRSSSLLSEGDIYWERWWRPRRLYEGFFWRCKNCGQPYKLGLKYPELGRRNERHTFLLWNECSMKQWKDAGGME